MLRDLGFFQPAASLGGGACHRLGASACNLIRQRCVSHSKGNSGGTPARAHAFGVAGRSGRCIPAARWRSVARLTGTPSGRERTSRAKGPTGCGDRPSTTAIDATGRDGDAGSRGRDERVFRLWRMAPWVRAPFLLLRRPGVATALIAASFVAALPAATAAPFLSSSANATLHTQIGLTCPASVGDILTYDMGVYAATDYSNPSSVYPPAPMASAVKADEIREAKIAQVAASAGGLSAPQTVWHATSSKAQIGQQAVAVTSMTLTDFADHVHPISGPSGAGVWIPDGFANAYHVKVGDPFVYTSNWGPPTKLRVAAIYADLRGDPNNPAFCGMHDLIFGPRARNSRTTPYRRSFSWTGLRFSPAWCPTAVGRR